ncbi:MAG TPA: hypothetical protein VF528_14490 [Pyrinomonadaceae bacterium]
MPPKTVEDLRKRAEGKAIEKAYPQSKRIRNALYVVIVLIVVASGLLWLRKTLSTPEMKPPLSLSNESNGNTSSNALELTSQKSPKAEMPVPTTQQDITQVSGLANTIWIADVPKMRGGYSRFLISESTVTWEVHSSTKVIAMYTGTWMQEENIVIMKFPKQQGKIYGSVISSYTTIMGPLSGTTIEGRMTWDNESRPYHLRKAQ